MGITNILKINNRDSEKIKKYTRLKRRKTKKQIRKIEESLLAPDKLPPYVGEAPNLNVYGANSVEIVFSNPDDYKLFCRHFRVVEKFGNNTHDVDLLVNILKVIEKGRLSVNEKKEVYIVRKGRKRRL